jgi:hypothetical protein
MTRMADQKSLSTFEKEQLLLEYENEVYAG